MEMIENLEPILRTFWFIAIPVSIIFLIQTVMTFMGADAGDGLSPDFDGDLSGSDEAFQLFSFRNLINFLLGLSWAGISFYHTISNALLLIALSFLVGVLFVYVFFVIIKQIQKLAEDNSFQFANTLNKTGEVYLHIPANKTGKGKVIISVNGSVHELDAITNGAAIGTGSMVKVVGLENNQILIVESI